MVELDDTYRRRAVPAGSARYFSWLFAAPVARAPMLGIYALLAEWRAAAHPTVEPSVAAGKLAWWHEEMLRLRDGRPVHPIGRFLASLPGADATDFDALGRAVEAAAVRAPDRQAALDAPGTHADRLIGGPLRVAAAFGPGETVTETLVACTRALALGEYLVRTLEDGPGDAGPGRTAPQSDEIRAAAADAFDRAARALVPAERDRHRGLLVLAALGAHHLRGRRPPFANDVSLRDLFLAWRTAARAARAR